MKTALRILLNIVGAFFLATPLYAGSGGPVGIPSGVVTSCSGDINAACSQVVSGGNIAAGTVPNAALVTAPLTAASTLDATKLSGNLPALNGSSLTTLNAANISSGTLPVARGGTNQTTGATSFCQGTSASIAAATTDFIACGDDAAVALLTSEANAQQLIPAVCTISNLSVKLTSAANANTPVITVDKNTTGQALTCTVLNTATTCTDGSHTFTTAAGDLLSIKVANPASANATGVIYVAFQINC